ncbi:U11/U12 small nuclear ribonucleoprotein 48 kDa protein-like isoform X2 [Dendronephthya gigantea]|uniref:U11/U12 small nuclear ribonucleoprotein 48 kDa protein-like isoform X2 n=1 Tax=Dendronephthya gigantea TaxID=151771 RepID=UPI00106977DD|nr:U11/U12 small nuclear ribonucleoprotein 48 kDa protein-like isoform X2 [Dendronephthya gigantea]
MIVPENMEAKISDHAMQCRLNKITEISDVLNECNKIIDNLSERLHWDKKHLLSQNITRAQCPFNTHHVVKVGDLDQHKHKCYLKKIGFTPFESSSAFYSNDKSLVVSITADDMNSNQKNFAIPSDLHEYMYTPEERLNQYNADIKITSLKRKAERDQFESDLSESTQDSKEMTADNQKSELELLAEQRDYKRRRQSYRAKNVHITKRTPIEITREIINNRMQELENMYQETSET